MLQQSKLRVVRNKQERSSRVHFGAKVVWVKWLHLCIEGAIEVPHLGRNCIAFVIFLNVSEVANGATAGSKEVSILKAAVKVSNSHGDDSPLLPIKVLHSTVNTCFDSRTSLSSARNLALNWYNHRAPIVMSHCRKTLQVAYMNFARDCHHTARVPLCLNTMKEHPERGK